MSERTLVLMISVACLANGLCAEKISAQPAQEVIPVIVDNGENQLGMAFMRVKDALSPINLSKLVQAKYHRAGEQASLVFLMEQYRTEERTTKVLELRQETRTRKIKTLKDGKEQEIDQEYTVQVPVSVEKTGPVRISAGRKPVMVPLEKIAVYRLDGSSVDTSELAELLAEMQPVFLARPTGEPPQAASAIVRQAVNPNLLIVLTDEIQL